MAAADKKASIADALDEQYYQINLDILESFSKYRPPLNLYRFKEDVARVLPYCKAGERLSNEQVEQLAQLVDEGLVFVSREDHPVYVKHISYQLDLVLVDKNLHETEIADIFTQALTRRLGEFFSQPVPLVFGKLWTDMMVLTEYLYADANRIRALSRRLHQTHTLANHSFNSGIMGLAVHIKQQSKQYEAGEVKRKFLDHLTAGLFLHDLGMSKIPPFMLEKDKALTAEDRGKVQRHTQVGYEMLAKLDLRFPEVEECVTDHHERINGSGYPQKKQGQAIGPLGRLCGLVDSYCAMTTKHPYGEPVEPAKAVAQLAQDQGYDQELSRILQAMVMLQSKPK
ncbi:MAG TPA: HD domain-containing phosphohydrolase [Humidesulfovibrio sp.]|uniref:HD-GYP domain-containing protein n=1 Tax=Humidesulfovibrio sp. TaxID=2910988 RepID=UPI002CCDB40C|nr:HD domain-containing phosphohydrolase [Humidesulfovibrio sp.]HWR03620.1 HD domain-containing phosphohydrolase [Humidesulfovibrio sp.]